MRRVFWLGLLLISLGGCVEEDGRFVSLKPEQTGIRFSNDITEDDSINIFDFANVYNGGGVGIGDFNNDGLQDLYFTGNQVSNKLYLNKGKMKFDDVTEISGTAGNGSWSRGVAVVDINNDGLMDLYVCATAKRDPLKRKNLLYVNQGPGRDSIPVFRDLAGEYGLADTSQSTMAYFFDFDRDGDLDLFIAVNHIVRDEYANVFKRRNLNGEHPSTSRLFRNDFNDSLGHPFFTEISRQAGILIEGYTHAANIFDANNDGWPDILETNDYVSSNVLYINQRDGTFRDSVMEYFRHTAANSMGSDAVDMNNDGLDDVIEVDMSPQDNLRKKMFQSPSTYQTYQNSDQFGYQYQYVRNMVQVNQGPTVGQHDSLAHPVFTDQGYFAGIAETDWSWTPLVADYDNDGNRDIIFTNGFPKDITDRDFMMYRNRATNLTSKKDMLAEIPAVRIHNYVYRNQGALSFSDNTTTWGMEDPSFSNGAAYADLDNDGDMDVVINNIGSPASIYRNSIRIPSMPGGHFLDIRFKGNRSNINGIGARVTLQYKGTTQALTNMPYRGYISSVQQGVHFGLGGLSAVDTVLVSWPDGREQYFLNVPVDQTLQVDYDKSTAAPADQSTGFARGTYFTNITDSLRLGIVHREDDFVDFNVQKLMPHKLSDLGPGLAVGDVDGDGLDDLLMGGSIGYSTVALLQQRDGTFLEQPFIKAPDRQNKPWHDMGMLLFDADGDGDLDLYTAAGGNESASNSSAFRDRFYLNDGRGRFTIDTAVFAPNYVSKSCVRAVDFDRDGDLDLFVAGRCVPWMYPAATSCFLYRNDTRAGSVRFTDVTASVATELMGIGMTCDAIFSDFDNDGWPDLVLTGEFMPVRFFRNVQGKFNRLPTAIDGQTGWWNSVISGDFDNDGDLDYVAGNNGKNSFFRPTTDHPVRVYGKDFDNNGSFDALMSAYLMTSQADKTLREFTASTRDDMIKQMLEMRNKFKTYKDFATSTFDKMLTMDQMKDALVLAATNLSSSYIENLGNGKFAITALPREAQVSTVFGMLARDVNDDGNLDLVILGNDYGTEVSVGRADAASGLVLLGDGKGAFRPVSISGSGFYVPGNSKALVELANANKQLIAVASQNRGPLQAMQMNHVGIAVRAGTDEVAAIVTMRNGAKRKQEFYFGSGYLSASGRYVTAGRSVSQVQFLTGAGAGRLIRF